MRSFGATDLHISLKAEELFVWGPLHVTNAMVYGLICAIVLVVIVLLVARRVTFLPAKSKLAGGLEWVVEFIVNLLQGPLKTRALAVKYTPIFATFFLFIIFNNLMGLLPVVGPSLSVSTAAGEVPLLRPFTADLNGTIALAVISILGVQIMSVRQQGFGGHLKHYFTNQPWNPLNLFIGLLEVFGELTRIASLCLRLFLNTAVGEILIVVFTSVILSGGRTPLAVLPIFLFEILVAGIQAYVFTILSATYLGLAIAHADNNSDDNHNQSAAIKKVDSAATI